MNTYNVIKKLKSLISYLEILLGIIVAIGVIAGIPNLVKFFPSIFHSPATGGYDLFQEFLRQVLMLVVGLELMHTILTHSHESILTLVLFVIARKMMVYAKTTTEVFIGSLSIAVIFFVLRFLSKDDRMLAKLDQTFSAALPVEKIRREYGLKVPVEISHTLGGLIYELCKENNVNIEKGAVVEHGSYRYTIHSVRDGVIERVMIKNLE